MVSLRFVTVALVAGSSGGGGRGYYLDQYPPSHPLMKTEWAPGVSPSPGNAFSTSSCQYSGGGPPYYMGISSGNTTSGHYHPGASGLEMRCSCSHPPSDRTILHGILTGRGYKFGYGGIAGMDTGHSPFFPTHPHAFHEPFYMGLEPIEAHTK